MGFTLRIEGDIHSHNVFSNYNGSPRLDLDSPMESSDWLVAAYNAGINYAFLSNHNTPDGYRQILDYQKCHENPKFKRVKVFPGMEMSAHLSEDKDGHILGLGFEEKIKRNLSVEETVEKIKSYGGVSIAAHPFGLISSIGNESKYCELVEIFNSNNVDIYSDFRAEKFAREEKKYGIAGSDSHIISTVGKCRTIVCLEDKNIDDISVYDIVRAFREGRFLISRASYNEVDDFREVLHYQLSEPAKLLQSVRKNHGPVAEYIGRFFINRFEKNPDAFWVKPAARTLLKRIRNLSKKVNAYGHEESLLDGGSWVKKVIESFLPLNRNKSLTNVDFDQVAEELRIYESLDSVDRINSLNDELRAVPLVRA